MKTTILAALVAASLSATPAFAQDPATVRVTISPAGLDLTTAEGRAALDLRLVHAVRTACGTPSPADAHGRTKAAWCLAEARTAAAAQREVLIAQATRRTQPTLASR